MNEPEPAPSNDSNTNEKTDIRDLPTGGPNTVVVKGSGLSGRG